MKLLCNVWIASLIVSLMTLHVSADDRMDAAVADMRSYLDQNGFPYDMFKQEQERVDSIQVNTTWWAFERGMAAVFEVHFPRPTPPSGFFFETSSFLSKDFDFEEAVMQAIWGEKHSHAQIASKAAISHGTPPEIKSEFQRGTRVQYQQLAEHIQSILEADGHHCTIRPGLSDMCEVSTDARHPPQGLHSWYRKHMRWALVIRVKETSGTHGTVTAGRAFSSTKSRIVQQGYVRVSSTRDNRSIEIGPIFESSFRKHGADPFDLLGQGWAFRARLADGHRPSGGIQMEGPFQGKSPLLLMTSGSQLPGYLSPHQEIIAKSLQDN